MGLDVQFKPLELDKLTECVQKLKDDGYRFVQLLCVNTDDGIDIQYSFMKDGVLENYTIPQVKEGTEVPSITDKYFAAFVFENEAHDLFGVNIVGSLLDFKGNFYKLAEKEPMRYLSPEYKEAREKAAAKAGKGDAPKKASAANDPKSVDDKLKGMDPEKAAKVKAAMEAKAAREAAANGKDGE